jgi:alkylation response protein AidB-like acyl-CoA dehydrogenase
VAIERRQVRGDVDDVREQAPIEHCKGRRGHGHTLRSMSMTAAFELSEEQEALRSLVRDFAQAEIAPNAEAWDRDHVFPVDVVLRMGELGLFGLPFPEEYGGGGADLTTLCIAIEELARVDHSMAITLEAGVGLGANPIYSFGTEAQKQRWLPDLCAGRALGAFGLTEPEAGSDAGGTRTKATLDEGTDEWVIDGEKAFITNSGTPITSIITVTARTGPGQISAIVVPAGTPGLTVQPPYRKMGWHASDTHGLTFDGCRVPAANLLGERGRGFAQFLSILDDGRVAIAALAVGAIEACLEVSTQYAKDRNAFGKPIGANQAVAFKCADLAVLAANARLLTYDAAWRRDTGRPFKQAAAMAKLYATEGAVTATREATQIFGGYGFIDETPVSRFYRDAKILEIGEGTSEIQRLVIARELGLPVE